MASLTNEQVLTRLHEQYHEDFQQLVASILQPGEAIAWAGNFSLGGYVNGYDGWDIGYFLVTSTRAIRVSFRADEGFLITKRGTSKIRDEYYYIDLLKRPLNKKEKAGRTVTEKFLDEINEINRQDYHLGLDKTIVEIILPDPIHPMLFHSLEEGKAVYDLMYGLIQNHKRKGQAGPENLVEQLRMLEDDHRYCRISDETYEAAKKRLLG